MKLEKIRATQQEIEEFKTRQAEWRRLEQERMEAENKRIREFMNLKQHEEETRTAKMREREEAKEQLRKTVELPLHSTSDFHTFVKMHIKSAPLCCTTAG